MIKARDSIKYVPESYMVYYEGDREAGSSGSFYLLGFTDVAYAYRWLRTEKNTGDLEDLKAQGVEVDDNNYPGLENEKRGGGGAPYVI